MVRKETLLRKIINSLSAYGKYLALFSILVFTSAILAGIIYAAINRVPPALFLRGGMIIVVSSRDIVYTYFRQTGIETVGVAFLLFLCGISGLLMVETPKRIKDLRLANIVFIIGSVLFIASMLIILSLYIYGKGWSIPF